jgi:hypothetical protein
VTAKHQLQKVLPEKYGLAKEIKTTASSLSILDNESFSIHFNSGSSIFTEFDMPQMLLPNHISRQLL